MLNCRAIFKEDASGTLCDSLATFCDMKRLMRYIFAYNYTLYTYCCWSPIVKITVSYTGNTKLIKKAKKRLVSFK